MKSMEIIPAIDIIQGKCVRLSKGDYNKMKIYSADPLEVARKFEEIGVKRLHLVDLEGAKSNEIKNHEVLEKISKYTSLIIDFGGGIKSEDSFKKAFDYGASMVTGGTIAITNTELFSKMISKYGKDKIILGADVKGENIAINGWMKETKTDIYSFLDYYINLGLDSVICTDISKDGMMIGPSKQLYKDILKKFPKVKLIASGGVTNEQDVAELNDIGCYGAIIGKAIYENTIKLENLI